MGFAQTVPEISPGDLARALEAGQAVQVLDIRAAVRVAAGRIDLAPENRFHNIVGSQLVTAGSPDRMGLDPGLPVAVVCGHGNDSKHAALYLNYLGFQASSLRGGMAGWMQLAMQRDLPPPSSLDHLVQFDRVGKGALGYLLVSDGAAFIIDPPRDPSAYLAAAAEASAKVVGVADTHCHADYLSGGPALAAALEVPYYLHPADSSYPYDGTPGRLSIRELTDGSEIALGRASVRASHTPGHTEGSVTFLVDDEAAFTGDFIFVASIGRPDLAGKTAEWTEQLWASLGRARDQWDADLAVYPAHYAVEEERNPDRSVGARMGDLLQRNEPLGMTDHDAFVHWVLSRTGEFPEAYRKIKAANVGLLEVSELEAEELEVGRNECALG
jgi:glyoxylase-like metal-dependent hydrolase (beta-lactamase superfamily II)